MTALLLAACTQYEMPGDGNTLPEGVYPLEIASVAMDVQGQPAAVECGCAADTGQRKL